MSIRNQKILSTVGGGGDGRRCKKSPWVKPWLANRRWLADKCFWENICWLKDEDEFRKYLRISTETYQIPVPYFIYFDCYS